MTIKELNAQGIKVLGTQSKHEVWGTLTLEGPEQFPVVHADNGQRYEISWNLMDRLLDGHTTSITA